jgi:hypothetical protein
MNYEYKYVVKPLIDQLTSQKKNWKIHTPKFHTSATGWDIEARSKNLDLLIEAKFMGNGSFLSKLNALVTAPLANRRRFFSKSNRPYVVCWAFGSKRMKPDLFRRLWDYIIRNPVFWKHYCIDLKVKYIYLVKTDSVARMDFSKFLSYAPLYKKLALNKPLAVRKKVVLEILQKHFKRIYKKFYCE